MKTWKSTVKDATDAAEEARGMLLRVATEEDSEHLNCLNAIFKTKIKGVVPCSMGNVQNSAKHKMLVNRLDENKLLKELNNPMQHQHSKTINPVLEPLGAQAGKWAYLS